MTKAKTDTLIELACSFDLCWPVKQPGAARALRQVEDLKYHHYQVRSLLTQRRVERAIATQLGRGLGHRKSARGGGEGQRNFFGRARCAADSPRFFHSFRQQTQKHLHKQFYFHYCSNGCLPNNSYNNSTTTASAATSVVGNRNPAH